MIEYFEMADLIKQTHSNFAILKQKFQNIRDQFNESMRLRIHRAISWLEPADNFDEIDAKFLFLWISFNAMYAEINFEREPEYKIQKGYFEKLVEFDSHSKIYHAVWNQFSGPIRLLLDNKYVFHAFWDFQNGVEDSADWEERFKLSKRQINRAMGTKDTVKILTTLFSRLYVLRNQLIHGAATWNSSTNRTQLKDGVAILTYLLPVFIDIMMENYDQNWGKPLYPVIAD